MQQILSPFGTADDARIRRAASNNADIDLIELKGAEKEQVSISVIVPVFHGSRFIKEAIESVTNQTVLPLELILVEDGPSDDSLSIVRNMELPFPIIEIRQKNGGQGSARNAGVKVANGDFIAFLDQDDKWYPEHLERLLGPFKSNSRLGWTYSNLDEIDETGQQVNIGFLNNFPAKHPKRSVADMLGCDMFVLPSASIIRKEAFLAVAGFDERLKGYEDDDLFLRLFRQGYSNAYLDESLSQWRIHGTSSSANSSMAISRRIYADKLCEMFPDNAAMSRYWIRGHVAPRFLSNSLGDYFAAKTAKDHAKCQKSLEDLLYYSSFMPWKARLKLRVKTMIWQTHLFTSLFLDKLKQLLS